jgi:AcrR family transcriptional regulator
MIIHQGELQFKRKNPVTDNPTSPDPIRTLQAQLVAARRTQILDAATEVFARKGYNRATIRNVAQAAGIADGTIYNYFANKADLLMGLLDRLNDTERRPEDLALASQAPMADYFRTYLRQRVEVLWANADLFRAVLPELLATPQLGQRYYDEVIEPTMTLAEAAMGGLVASGNLRDLDLPLSMRIVAGSVLGVMMLQLLGDETLATRWQEIPDVLADLLLHGLLPAMPSDEDAN